MTDNRRVLDNSGAKLGVCKSIFSWNRAQYVEAEWNKYFKRKKGRNYMKRQARQACFVNRFTLQGFNERIFM